MTTRTIDITDKTYILLEKLLSEEQPDQVKRHGKPICEKPEDMIPWLIGYYQQMQKGLKK